jgi:hypothetical protein
VDKTLETCKKHLEESIKEGYVCEDVLKESVTKTCENQRKLEGQMINESLRQFNHDLRDKAIGVQKRIVYDNIYETDADAFETCNPLIDSYNINFSREKDKSKGKLFSEIQNVSGKQDMLFIIVTVANFTTLNVYEKGERLITRDKSPYKYTNDPVGSSLPPYYIDHVELEKLYFKSKYNKEIDNDNDNVLKEALAKVTKKYKNIANKELPKYLDDNNKIIDYSVKDIISILSKHNSATLIGTLQNADQIGSLIRRNSIITKAEDVDLVEELDEYGVFTENILHSGGKNIVDRRVLTNRKQRRVKTNRKQNRVHTNKKQRRVKTNRKQRRVHTNKKQRKIRTNRKYNIDMKKKEKH